VGAERSDTRRSGITCAVGETMALTNLKPFDGLSVITSEMDEIEVGHLLKATKNLGLICQECGSQRFKAAGFIPVNVEILAGVHIILAHVDYKEVIINRVIQCAQCGSTDFITITEAAGENNG